MKFRSYYLAVFGVLLSPYISATENERFHPDQRVVTSTGMASVLGRTVSYQVVDGMAVAGGDILLGDAHSLLTAPISTGNQEPLGSVSVSSRSRWPGGIVPYRIDSALSNPQRVLDAIAHWNQSLNGIIQFIPRTTQSDYVYAQPGSGCSAIIGHAAGAQFVYLADGCTTGSTIHELGHSLGLWREQDRNDRDNHVTIHFENIAAADASQFQKTGSVANDRGVYDYDSIMHYSAYAFSNNGQPTIVTIPAGIPIGQRSALSAGDIATVQAMYGSSAVTPPPVTLTPVEVDDIGQIKIYPNPWRSDRHTVGITFQSVGSGAELKIFSVSGRLVREILSSSANVEWDVRTSSGENAASGIYLYVLTNPRGQTRRGKLAVIR